MITFTIDGQEFRDIKSATLSDAIDEFSGSFSFTTSTNIGAVPGSLCVAFVDGEKRLTGYIDSADVTYSVDSHDVTFSGRSKTQDIIDSTIGGTVSIAKSISLIDAIQVILDDINSPIKIIDNADTNKFENFEKVSGEIGDNAFELISKYCRKKQVLLTSDGDANIVLTRGESKDSGLSLINGENGNIKQASGFHTLAKRFYKYKVTSQIDSTGFNFSSEVSAKKIASQDGEVLDDQIRVTRVLNIIAETSSTDLDCEKRADWMARINRSRSISYRATVAFHNQGGTVWSKGEIVKIDDLFVFNESVDMLIKKLTFTQGQESITELELVPDDTYKNLANQPVKIEKKESFVFSSDAPKA